MGNITHEKVSAIPDGDDETLVKPSDWNADHEVSAPVAGHDVATKEYVDTADGVLDYGLSFKGEITAVIDTTHFDVASLIGMGTGFFKPLAGSPYEIYIVQADGATPEGEQTPVVAYTSVTGRFQHTAFSANLAIGDVVLIQHPVIAALGAKATVAATGAVTTTDFSMAYLKQLVTELQVVDALVDTILVDTGTTIPATLAAIVAYLDTEISAILEDTGTTLPAQITALVTDYLGHGTHGLAALETLVDSLETWLGDPSGHILATITAKIGNIARSLDLIIGSRWDSSGNLGTDIAQLLTYCDILDNATNGLANIKSLIDTITAYVDCLPAALGDIVTKNEADIIDNIWDEPLTGATHNVATSAGKRLRQAGVDAALIREDDCQAGSTSSTIVLDSNASATDHFYDHMWVYLTEGTGAGQVRTIHDYVGSTKIGGIAPDWLTIPDATTKFVIIAQGSTHVHELEPVALAQISAIDNIATKVMGRLQIATTTEDLNQAAGTYDLFTGTTQAVILEKLNVKMPTGAAGGAVTSIAIVTDDATPGIIISPVTGAVANLTSEADLGWTGTLIINVGTKIRLTIAGGAHGSEYLTTIVAQCRAAVSGGYLA